jgi:hypothetical protein
MRPNTAPYVSIPCTYVYVRPDQSLGGKMVLITLPSRRWEGPLGAPHHPPPLFAATTWVMPQPPASPMFPGVSILLRVRDGLEEEPLYYKYNITAA